MKDSRPFFVLQDTVEEGEVLIDLLAETQYVSHFYQRLAHGALVKEVSRRFFDC